MKYITAKCSMRNTLFLASFIGFFFLIWVSVTYGQATDATPTYSGAESLVYTITFGLGGFFAGLGGMLFDLAINNLVLQMGDLFLKQGLGSVVNSIWTIIRDLLNILFIFSLVYIGLKTIWDADDSRTKKMLGMLIAAALLINFSLYIAKVVVDIANFTAVEIHTAAVGGITKQFGIKGDLFEYTTGNYSLSGAYMQTLSAPSWFSTGISKKGVVVYSIMGMLFLMFLGFVLAYGALMLTARFIAIIFYLMFSPFMFLGWILPQFQKYSTKWWQGFLGYSFFAPVYIFMLYIGLYALQQIKEGFVGSNGYAAAFADGRIKTPSDFTIFLFFIIGTGFLLAATKVASSMSNGGAAIGMNMADKFSKRVIPRVDKAAASWMYRNTGGRLAGGVLNTMDRIDRSLANRQSVNAKRGMLKPRKLLTGAALSLGREAVGGTASRGAVEGARNYGAGGRGLKQVDDDMKSQNERTSKANKKTRLQKQLKSGSDHEKQSAWKQFSTTEIDEMAKDHKGRATLLNNAHFLTDDHMKKLKSEHPELHTELSKKIADKLDDDFDNDTKRSSVFQQFQKDTTAIPQPKTSAEIAKLPTKILTDERALPYITDKVLRQILIDGKMPDADMTIIRDNIDREGSTLMTGATYRKAQDWLSSNEGRFF